MYSSIADRLLQGIELSPAAHYPPYLVIIPLFPCAPDSVLGRDKGQQLDLTWALFVLQRN